MRFIVHKAFVISLLLCVVFSAFPQNGDMIFDYITADDGLSDNRVQVIFRDSKDYIWIGGYGLNKYDGNKVTIYKHNDNQTGSISNDNIYSIYEDSKNNLWIGTFDGLNLYNPHTDSFTVIKHSSVDSLSNFVTCIFEDKNGNLWITYNDGGGLCKWDYEKQILIHYQVKDEDENYFANSITSGYEDSKGNLWFVSRSPSIYLFEPKTENFIAYNIPGIDINSRHFKTIYIDQNDKIWIGSNGDGLYSFIPSTSTFKHFDANVGNKGLNSQLIIDIIQTDDYHLLIATNQGGINKYNMVTNTFEYIVQNEKVDHGLSSNGIFCLYQDKEGILWVGTIRGGVNYYNPKEHKFKLYNHIDNTNSLSYNIVGCFYEDSKGLIWIGTDGGGINVYDPKTRNFTYYKHDPSDPYSISGDVIRCIAEDKDGDMWIGTWNAGLNRYDRSSNKFYQYYSDKKDSSSVSAKTIWHLIVDHNNNVWLGSFSQGLEVLDPKKGVIKRFVADSDNPRALSNDYIWFIHEDLQHNIFVCTNFGINIYDSISNSFSVCNNFDDNGMMAFCKDKNGQLWAGNTRNGLFLFEQDGTIIKRYDTKDGLPDNTIHAIIDDNQGNLWISTNKGISKFNPEKQEFKNYYKNDGLQGNLFFQQSFLKTRNGEIYFGGYNGFNSFHPDSIKVNDYIPKVYITGFNLFNKPVQIGGDESPLQNHISETKEITLSWREAVISFEYTAMNYTHPEKTEYAYIMEGFEKEWNYVGSKRDATYTRLEAGEYTFRVKASNNDGVWNEEGTSIKLIITPPLWKTWWFRSIAGLLAAAIIFIIYYMRVSSLRNQKIILEKKVNQRTKELKMAYDNIRNNSEFGQKITSTLNFSAINGMIYKYIRTFIDTFDYGIGINIPEKGIIEYKMFYQDGKLIDPQIRQLSNKNSFCVYCIENQETVFINDLNNEYKKYFSELPSFFSLRFPNSLINIPLTVNNKRIGLLAINSIKKNAFSENDLLKLQTLASYIAIALDNANVYQQLELINKELQKSTEVLNETNTLLEEKQEEVLMQNEELNTQKEALQEVNSTLEEKQEEIFMQNEELRVQKENLQETNCTLEEQAEEIESQNNELNRYRNHLEQLVKERTSDLVVAMEKVKESERLKSSFLSNMSHEIRTPMNAIVGFSSLLNDPDLSKAEMEEIITYIGKNSESLLVLIDDILEMAQIQANQLPINTEPVNAIEIMNELFASFQLQAQPKSIELICETDSVGDLLICNTDPVRLKQVLSNLISNAIKFTEKGFVKYGITLENQGFVTFYVKDSGIGISKEVGDSIFKRFIKVESTKTKLYDGVGLGLSICYSIVEVMGGEIWYESEFGKGTTFFFTVPYVDSEKIVVVDKRDKKQLEILNLEEKQILIVEDNEPNYKLLLYYLSKTKANLTWAKNGLEALEKTKSNDYDLILMDLKLPVMNGIEATKLIRQIKPDQIIVAQTAFAQKQEKNEFLKCEFNGYIEKPIAIEKLMKVLNEVF